MCVLSFHVPQNIFWGANQIIFKQRSGILENIILKGLEKVGG